MDRTVNKLTAHTVGKIYLDKVIKLHIHTTKCVNQALETGIKIAALEETGFYGW